MVGGERHVRVEEDLQPALGRWYEVEEPDARLLPNILSPQSRRFLGTATAGARNERNPSLRPGELAELRRAEDGCEVCTVVGQSPLDVLVIPSDNAGDALERVSLKMPLCHAIPEHRGTDAEELLHRHRRELAILGQ